MRSGVTGVVRPTHRSRHRQVPHVLDLELLDLLPHRLQELHCKTRDSKGQQRANQRAAVDDVKGKQVSHLVGAGLPVRCSPWSESETTSSASSLTSSTETETRRQPGGPSLSTDFLSVALSSLVPAEDFKTSLTLM